MTRSRSMSGISLVQKLAIIEENLMKDIDEGSSMENVRSRLRKQGILPSGIAPEELVNSWPLLTLKRALFSGLLTSILFFGGIIATALFVWLTCGFRGLVACIAVVEGCFCLFSKWRYKRLNSQPPRHESATHDGWDSFHKFLNVVKMRGPDGNLLMNMHDYMNVWVR